MSATIGGPLGVLDPSAVDDFIVTSLRDVPLDGRSLCLVIPDTTRNCPLRTLLRSVGSAVRDRVSSCTAVVALGTHQSGLLLLSSCGPGDLNGDFWG